MKKHSNACLGMTQTPRSPNYFLHLLPPRASGNICGYELFSQLTTARRHLNLIRRSDVAHKELELSCAGKILCRLFVVTFL
jgi:hypothetical protein